MSTESNASELSWKIRNRNKKKQEQEEEDERKRKLRKQQEEEEEEEKKKKSSQQKEDTEEDDENLANEDDNNKSSDRKSKDNDDDDDNDDDNNDDNDSDDYDDSDDEQKDHRNNDKDNNKDNNEKDGENQESSNRNEKNNDSSGNRENAGNQARGNNNSSGNPTSSANNGNSSVGNGHPRPGGKPTPSGGGTTPPPGIGGAGSGVTGASSAGAGAAGTGVGAGSAGAGAAAGAGSAGAGAAAGAGIGIFGIVIIIIIIIIIVIGILFFFIGMPGMVVGKIGDVINGARKQINLTINGNNAETILVSKKDMIDAAEYLDQMGYDLNGYGFLDKEVKQVVTAVNDDSWKARLSDWWNDDDVNEAPTYRDFSTKTIAERKAEDPSKEYVEVYLSQKYTESDLPSQSDLRGKIILSKNQDGEIEFVRSSKYLLKYLAAGNAVYLVRNFNTNLDNRAKKILNMNNTKEGSGLISFKKGGSGVSQYVDIDNSSGVSDEFAGAETWGGIFDRVSIDRENKTMTIENSDDGWFRKTYYEYSLDGWVSQYGVPLQLSLTNHLSTMAPDFAASVAGIGAEDTMVEFGLLKTTGNTFKMKLYLNLDGHKKYYYVKKKETTNWKLTGATSNETESSLSEYNAKVILGYTPDATREKFTENVIPYNSQTVQNQIDELKAELEEITDGGNEKIDIGQFIPAFELSVYDEEHKPEHYDYKDSGGNYYIFELKKKDLKYEIQNNHFPPSLDKMDQKSNETHQRSQLLRLNKTEYIIKIIKILFENNIADIQEVQTAQHSYYTFCFSSPENYNSDQMDKIDELKNIFSSYFEQTGDLIDNFNRVDKYNNNGSGNSFDLNKLKKEDGKDWYIYDEEKLVNSDNSAMNIVNRYKEKSFLLTTDTSYGYGVLNMGGILYYYADMDFIWKFLFNEDDYFKNLAIATDFYETEKKVFYRLIDVDTGDVYTDIGSQSNDFDFINPNNHAYYDNSKGWFWDGSIPKKIETAFDPDGSVTGGDIVEVLNKVVEAQTNDFTKYVPIILQVKDHWYQDISFKGCYKWDTSQGAQTTTGIYSAGSNDGSGVTRASQLGTIYTEETTRGKVIQISDGKPVGTPGEKINALLRNDYYIYDGSGTPKGPQKINFENTAIDAIAMLEEIQGEDAQSIIRMYKELMLQHGIYFQESTQTTLKKQLFSRVIQGYNAEDKILTEGDDSVIKAYIPPTQEDGFQVGLNVVMPINGRITYRTDDSVCIQIIAPGEEFDNYTILIAGFDVDDSVSVDQQLMQGAGLGKTLVQDLKLTLRDENGAIVKNSYTTETLSNHNVKITGIKYTVEELRNIFTQYKNETGTGQKLIDNVQAFYNIQTRYGVDPLFAAAVTITESSAGEANTSLVQNAYNWVSIKGSKNGGFAFNGSLWNKYSSYADAIEGTSGFADLMANGSYYFNAGKYTISEIGPTYCDAQWAVDTSNYMDKLISYSGRGSENAE